MAVLGYGDGCYSNKNDCNIVNGDVDSASEDDNGRHYYYSYGHHSCGNDYANNKDNTNDNDTVLMTMMAVKPIITNIA